jgi:hypothetical protein
MLVARHGRWYRAGQGARNLLQRSQRRVALEHLRERPGARLADLVARKAAARRGGSGMLVAPAQSRARATYSSDVSTLNAFASLSLFLPLLSSPSTIAWASIFASNAASKRPPPENSSLNRARRCQRSSARLVPLPLFSLVERLRLRASVLSALRPGHDAPFDRASRARDARRARQARQARSPRALAPRARPARLSASALPVRPPVPPVPAPSPRSRPPPARCALSALRAARPAGVAAACLGEPRLQARKRDNSAQHRRSATHKHGGLHKHLQQPARGAVQLVGRLLRWGELVRW